MSFWRQEWGWRISTERPPDHTAQESQKYKMRQMLDKKTAIQAVLGIGRRQRTLG